MVRLVDHPALGAGRGEGPGDRHGLRRGERQVDVADPGPGSVHSLVILLHCEFDTRGRAAGQDVFTLFRRQRLLPGTENRLKAPDSFSRDFNRQSRSVHLPSRQDIFKLGTCGHAALIHRENRSDALGRGSLLPSRDLIAVRALTIQEVGDVAGREGFGGVYPKPPGQRRVHVPAGHRRRAAVVLAGTRPHARTVEAFARALAVIASLAMAGAVKRSNGFLPLHHARGDERSKRADRHRVPGQRAAFGIGAVLRQTIGFSRHQLVKRLTARKSTIGHLGRIPCHGGGRWCRRAQALVIVLRHRRHLWRQRLLQQMLAHRACRGRGARGACPVSEHVSVSCRRRRANP